MNISLYRRTIYALCPRGWMAAIIAFAFLFFLFSVAANTRFSTHVSVYFSAMFLFSILVASMLRELKAKALSFSLPDQHSVLAGAVISMGICFVLLLTTVSLYLLELNEDAHTYPLETLRANRAVLFFWSLSCYLLVVSLIVYSMAWSLLIYLPIMLFGPGAEALVSMQQGGSLVWPILASVVGSLVFWFVISSRIQARNLVTGSFLQALQTRGAGIQASVFAVLKQIRPSFVHHAYWQSGCLILSKSMIALAICLVMSLWILATLLTGFKSIDYVHPFYLYLFPLMPLSYPVFRHSAGIAPWLPLGRQARFSIYMMQATFHFLFALVTLSLVHWLLYALLVQYPEANWGAYAQAALDLPVLSVYCLALFAPLASLVHLLIRSVMASFLVCFLLGVILFNKLESMPDILLLIDVPIFAYLNIVASLALIATSYLYGFRRDLRVTPGNRISL